MVLTVSFVTICEKKKSVIRMIAIRMKALFSIINSANRFIMNPQIHFCLIYFSSYCFLNFSF